MPRNIIKSGGTGKLIGFVSQIKLLEKSILGDVNGQWKGWPHGVVKTPNNKLFISSNTSNGVHVLNNINESLNNFTSIEVANEKNSDLTYSSNYNRVYAVSHGDLYYINPDSLSITYINSVNISNEGNASITNDNSNLYIGISQTIKKYSMSDHTFLMDYNIGNGYCHSIKVTPNNEYVLATTINNPSIGGGKLIKIKISDNTISSLDFSSEIGTGPTDDFVILGDYIYIGDEESGKCGKINWKTMLIESVYNSGVKSWFVSTDERYVIFGGKENKIFVLDTLGGQTNVCSLNALAVSYDQPEEYLNELVHLKNNIWIGTNYSTKHAKIFKFKINPFGKDMYGDLIYPSAPVNSIIRYPTYPNGFEVLGINSSNTSVAAANYYNSNFCNRVFRTSVSQFYPPEANSLNNGGAESLTYDALNNIWTLKLNYSEIEYSFTANGFETSNYIPTIFNQGVHIQPALTSPCEE